MTPLLRHAIVKTCADGVCTRCAAAPLRWQARAIAFTERLAWHRTTALASSGYCVYRAPCAGPDTPAVDPTGALWHRLLCRHKCHSMSIGARANSGTTMLSRLNLLRDDPLTASAAASAAGGGGARSICAQP